MSMSSEGLIKEIKVFINHIELYESLCYFHSNVNHFQLSLSAEYLYKPERYSLAPLNKIVGPLDSLGFTQAEDFL